MFTTSGSSYSLVLTLGSYVPATVINSVSCVSSNTSIVTITSTSAQVASSAIFTCTFNALQMGAVNINLVLNNYTISNAPGIPIHVLYSTSSIAFDSSSRQVALSNTNLNVTLVSSVSVPSQSKVLCFQNDTGISTPASIVNAYTYTCTVYSGGSVKSVSVSLVYYFKNYIYMTGNNLTVHFIDQGTIALASNLVQTGTNFALTVFFANTYLPSVLKNRFKCFNGTSLVVASTLTSSMTCSFLSSIQIANTLTLYMDTFGGVDIVISLNTVPFFYQAQVSLLTMTPKSALTTATSDALVNITASAAILIHPDITYKCVFNNGNTSATYTAGSIITCLLTRPAQSQRVSVDVYMVTLSTNTQFRVSSNSLAFDYWLPVPLSYIWPALNIQSEALVASYTMTLQTGSSLLTTSFGVYCLATSIEGSFITTASVTSTTATCTINRSVFSGNTDYTDVYLIANATATSYIVISSNNKTIVHVPSK